MNETTDLPGSPTAPRIESGAGTPASEGIANDAASAAASGAVAGMTINSPGSTPTRPRGGCPKAAEDEAVPLIAEGRSP